MKDEDMAILLACQFDSDDRRLALGGVEFGAGFGRVDLGLDGVLHDGIGRRRSRCNRESSTARRDQAGRVVDVANTLHAVQTVVGGSGEDERSGLVSLRRRDRLGSERDVGSRELFSDALSTADLSLLLGVERSGSAEEAGSSVARNVAGTAGASGRSSR